MKSYYLSVIISSISDSIKILFYYVINNNLQKIIVLIIPNMTKIWDINILNRSKIMILQNLLKTAFLGIFYK